MITLLETTFTPGDDPATSLLASEVAFEADATETEATAMLSASWSQIEAFTGRTYRDTTAGKIIVKTDAPMQYQWPRYPFPDALTVEAYSGGFWASATASYVAEAGLIDLDPFTLYRLTQTGTVAGAPVTAGVEQAVYNLALYQLMQGPSRREYRSQTSGDFAFTREALMPVFRGSGAGALLASEVRQ
ncbi:hypothetical protein [Thalassovita sp.]|uniref:hypothetical protein n=1 Tax=Thalassovita sp. TaxID=1979401 RepID=UPI002B279AD0|nr:hypothetical protein [Thalassovita sp.]